MRPCLDAETMIWSFTSSGATPYDPLRNRFGAGGVRTQHIAVFGNRVGNAWQPVVQEVHRTCRSPSLRCTGPPY